MEARSKALNTIPEKKLDIALSAIKDSDDTLDNKLVKSMAINRYAESNIPIEYWGLKMSKDFVGDPRLKEKYDEYVLDIRQSYVSGRSICFAGQHGLGKSMTATAILKKCCLKNYSCLYSDISNIVSIFTQGQAEDKYLARRELLMVDFLMIDEIDQRFFKQSDAANETFARTLEFIIRSRTQNKLPVLMATNSPQIKEAFANLFKDSISSIMNKIEMFSVMPGNDFRKTVK